MADDQGDVEELLRVAYAWMRELDMDASRAFLESHPELLSDEGFAKLEEFAVYDRLGNSPSNAFLALAAIAGTARRDGIATAYAHREELFAKLRELIDLLKQVDDDPRPEHVPLLERALRLGDEASVSGLLELNFRLGYAWLNGSEFRKAATFFRIAIDRRESVSEKQRLNHKYFLAVALSQWAAQLSDGENLTMCIESMDWLIESGAPPLTAGLLRTASGVARHFFLGRDWRRAAQLFALALDRFDDIFETYSPMSREGVATHVAGLPAALAYASLCAHGVQANRTATDALERGRIRGQGLVLHREAVLLAGEDVLPEELRTRLRQASLRITLAERAGVESNTPQSLAREGFQEAYWDRLKADAGRLQELGSATDEYKQVCDEIEALYPGALPARESCQMPAASRLLRVDEGIAYVGHTEAGSVAILWARSEDGEIAVRSWIDEELSTEVVQDCLIRTERGLFRRRERGLLVAQQGGASMPDEVEAAVKALSREGSVINGLAVACQEDGIKHLVLVPCGFYALLPLHATTVAGSAHRTARSLADVIRVSYAHSVETWFLGRIRADRRKQRHVHAVVVSDPQPMPRNATPLLFAAQEGRFLAHLVDGLDKGVATTLQRTDATCARVLDAVRASVVPVTHVHFACHAFADLAEPKRSGLLLSEAEVLTVFELADPASNSVSSLRLAVLAACQTALVGTELVDEAIGLPAAWFQAGAATVVASLWPMSDAATFAIMKKFYQLHLVDQLPPSEALWLAQRWLRGLATWRQEFRDAGATHSAELLDAAEERRGAGSSARAWDHPVYWAGFVCYGD